MPNLIQTNEIAISAEEVRTSAQKDARYWHEKAVTADKNRSGSSLDHAEALYHLKKDKGYEQLGFPSMDAYVFESFGKSGKWAEKLISVHTKFVVELGKTKEELVAVGFSKVAKLVSVAEENTVDTILEEAAEMTQKEIDEKIREEKGLKPNEAKADEEYVTLKLQMQRDFKEVYDAAIEVAADQYLEDQGYPPKYEAQSLEMIVADYLTTRLPSGSSEDQIDDTLERFANRHKINISWERRGNSDE